jgi:hypothetical protein
MVLFTPKTPQQVIIGLIRMRTSHDDSKRLRWAYTG